LFLRHSSKKAVSPSGSSAASLQTEVIFRSSATHFPSSAFPIRK
jgi:hypothetical protein